MTESDCYFQNFIKRSLKILKSHSELENDLTHYSLVLLSIPLENRKPKGFLMFSGGIEKQHQTVMG